VVKHGTITFTPGLGRIDTPQRWKRYQKSLGDVERPRASACDPFEGLGRGPRRSERHGIGVLRLSIAGRTKIVATRQANTPQANEESRLA